MPKTKEEEPMGWKIATGTMNFLGAAALVICGLIFQNQREFGHSISDIFKSLAVLQVRMENLPPRAVMERIIRLEMKVEQSALQCKERHQDHGDNHVAH